VNKVILSTNIEDANDSAINKNYDYIIVGAGSAGCVMARRLVEGTDANILLLEAGGIADGVDSIENPLRWLENIGSPQDYLYQYQPAPLLNNRIIYAPRGKVLGGSGSINAMVWARGNKDDYNQWESLGNKGWDYESVLPLFKKIEDWQGGETDFHGAGGPIHIESPGQFHFVDAAMIEAGKSYGMPYREDVNGPEPEGVGPMSMNIKDGKRCSPFVGYLKPVLEKNNLTVITEAKVLHLNLTGSKCTGLKFLHKGIVVNVDATNEVILCAGAIESPRILMLSGIGDEKDLQQLNIDARIDLPGVGKNLQDHPLISMMYETKEPLGNLTYNMGGSNLFWKSTPAVHKADLMLVPVQMGIATEEIVKQYPIPSNVFSVFVTLIDVKSRGEIKMGSSSHDAPLYIQPNFLQAPEDFKAMKKAVELCMALVSQTALSNIIKRWVAPDKLIGREEIESFIKNACSTYFHPVGTCAMGNGKDAVVSNELKVHGVEGLRIVDASIMPQITTSNTNAPTLMIGEFAAQLILRK
jgi:choline dehydrogenase